MSSSRCLFPLPFLSAMYDLLYRPSYMNMLLTMLAHGRKSTVMSACPVLRRKAGRLRKYSSRVEQEPLES
jgi:hypothetical protein